MFSFKWVGTLTKQGPTVLVKTKCTSHSPTPFFIFFSTCFSYPRVYCTVLVYILCVVSKESETEALCISLKSLFLYFFPTVGSGLNSMSQLVLLESHVFILQNSSLWLTVICIAHESTVTAVENLRKINLNSQSKDFHKPWVYFHTGQIFY